MSHKSTSEDDPTGGIISITEAEQQDSPHSGHPSRVCASLASHDILTILICNGAFIAAIDGGTLALLPDLAPQYKNVLSLVSEDAWFRVAQSHFGDRVKVRDIFGKVEKSIGRKSILQGICHFLTRKNGYPTSFETYQKELSLWAAVPRHKALRKAITSRSKGLGLGHPFDTVGYWKICHDDAHDAFRSLSPQDQFKILDSSIVLVENGQLRCKGKCGATDCRSTYSIVRFEHHPLHTDEQVSKLLPHELCILHNLQGLAHLRLINCAASMLSDRPRIMRRIKDLAVDDSVGRVIDLTGCPEMPQLESLTLRCNIFDLKGMPERLPALASLDLSGCAKLESLKGLSQLPNIRVVYLPPLVQSIDCLYQYFDQIILLDMGRCSRMETLAGFPPLPKLQTLRLPGSLQTLSGFPTQLNSLKILDMWMCDQLESIRGLPPIANLTAIKLPQSLYLKGMAKKMAWFRASSQQQYGSESEPPVSAADRVPNGFWISLALVVTEALSEASLSGNILKVVMEQSREILERFLGAAASEVGIPQQSTGSRHKADSSDKSMTLHLLSVDQNATYIGYQHKGGDGSLSVLEVPNAVAKWEPPLMDVAIQPDGYDFDEEHSRWRRRESRRSVVLSIEQQPKMKLLAPKDTEPLLRMPRRFDFMKDLELEGKNVTSLRGMPDMPMLEHLKLVTNVGSLQGLPSILPSLCRFDIEGCTQLKTLHGMSEMPKLTKLILPQSIATLEELPEILNSLDVMDLSRCTELASLKGLFNLPKLTVLKPPSGLKVLGMPMARLCSLDELDLSKASMLESLEGFPQTPKLTRLKLGGLISSLCGLPSSMPSLESLELMCHSLLSLDGMPEMPKLVKLTLPPSIRSLEGLPKVLRSLETMDLSQCSKLESLQGFTQLARLWVPRITMELVVPDMPTTYREPLVELDLPSSSEPESLEGLPSLKRLRLSGSFSSLHGLPSFLPSLNWMSLSGCSKLASLEAFPYTPNLKILYLDGVLSSLHGLPEHLPFIEGIYIHCRSLTSLEGFPPTPNLRHLMLPPSISSMRGLPNILPRLETLEYCQQRHPVHATSLRGCPLMPALRHLQLPASVRSFQGLPAELTNLEKLDLRACSNLSSVEGLPRMPLLQHLDCGDMESSLFGELERRLKQISPQLHVSRSRHPQSRWNSQ